MKTVIDTCSLLSLVRYYSPFDERGMLYECIKTKISSGEIVILDEVLKECHYVSRGDIIKTLPFLNEPSFLKKHNVPLKTDGIIAPSPGNFLNQVDNQFVRRVQRNRLDDSQYDTQKQAFLNSADGKIIICALSYKDKYPGEEVNIVTEETVASNDNKLFLKIPAICAIVQIPVLTLPEYLRTIGKWGFGSD